MQTSKLIALCLAVACWVGVVHAEVVQSQGQGTVLYSGHGFFGGRELTKQDKRDALRKAEINAIDYYFADQAASENEDYERVKSFIDAHLSKYILSYVRLNENKDSANDQYTITIRAQINGDALNDAVSNSSATAATPSNRRSYVMTLLVARQIASIKTFKARRYNRADKNVQVHGAVVGSGSVTTQSDRNGSEVQSLSQNQMSVRDKKSSSKKAQAEFSGKANIGTSTVTETGGSTLTKSSVTTWRIFPSENLDSAISGVMTRQGYNPVSEAYVEPYSKGALKIADIDRDFSKGNDLSPATLQHVVVGAKAAHVTYVALGTLDVGQTQTDPATGMLRVGVVVNAKVLDVAGPFPRQIAAIGPVQYFGNGPTELSAQTNALTEAGRVAARDLTSQMQDKGFH